MVDVDCVDLLPQISTKTYVSSLVRETNYRHF